MSVRFGGLLLISAALAGAAPALPAESRIEKTLRLEPGGTFSLQADLGQVRLKGTDRPGARIIVTSKRDDLEDLLRFQFEEGPGTARVVARKRHPISGFFGVRGGSIVFEVEVPAQTRVVVDTSGGSISIAGVASDAKLETSGGAIEVRDQTGDLTAHTSGGSISLSRVRGKSRVNTSGGGIRAEELDGPIDAETSGGSIDFDRVTGDIHAHSSGGGIRIREAGGRVDAGTSGGSVQVAFTRANARGGTIESSGGGVSVSVDPSVGLAIDAAGNSVDSDLPITVRGRISRRHLQGVLGRGGETLRLRTSGGSVRIKRL